MIYDNDKDTSAAYIYKQIPAYGVGSYLKMGEPIDLFLSSDAVPRSDTLSEQFKLENE